MVASLLSSEVESESVVASHEGLRIGAVGDCVDGS